MFSIGKGDANLKSLFNAKCHVVAKPPENIPNPEEATVEDAIEVGAEEVEPVEELPGYFKVSNFQYKLYSLSMVRKTHFYGSQHI